MSEVILKAPFIEAWRSIWLKPRQTMVAIFGTPRHPLLWAPAVVAGVASTLNFIIAAKLFSQFPPASLLLTAIMLGPVVGFLHVLMMGFFLRVVGRAFNGVADAPQLRLAVCWASVPVAMGILPAFIELHMAAAGSESFLINVLSYTRMGLELWGVLLMIMCVAEAQKFRFKEAAINVLSIFAFFFILMLLAQPA